MKNKTVNQLIDRIDQMKMDQMTPELGSIRQKLIDTKKACGGRAMVENTSELMAKINREAVPSKEVATERAVCLS